MVDRMKILLVAVNAKYIHSNLAIYSLRAYAREYSEYIALKELTINHSEEDILKEIYKEKADVIAFSCYIWNIGIIKRVTEELRKVQPEVKIWFGGPEVSYDALKCLEENEALDGIVVGEGEQTFLELVEYYAEEKKELQSIFGLAFRKSAALKAGWSKDLKDITVTADRQPIALDCIPFPYEDMKGFENKIVYYESSRGCPFSCSYCLSSIDKKVRLRNTETVKRELQFFLDHQVPQVKFVDRTFNCNKKHAMEIWSFIKEHDNKITNFHFEISADLLSEEEMDFLATLRPGQIQFEIGVQSTNPDTVRAIHRNMDLERLIHNVIRIREGRNIHQHLDLIAGLPLENFASFEKSFNDVYRLRPDQLQLGFLKILKGSGMEEDSAGYGITYRNTPPYEVLFTDRLSYGEVLKIKGVCEMVEVYYNSAQFDYSIRFLEHFFESPMMLFLSLSDFYEAKGIALMAHSRVKRYEILLDFYKKTLLNSKASKEEQNGERLFSEIMVLDLYLREAMKSRPEFAAKNPEQNKLLKLYGEYQKNRNQIHIEQFSYDVFTAAAKGHAVKKEFTVLFDYDNRDPLSKAARLTVLEE
jgi:radical SAM superfamily enzyme YgiQ (UPF0313 family)